jgi:hypothetical protein
MSTKSLVEWFSEFDAPRNGPALHHNLTERLVVAICAILAGARSGTGGAVSGHFQARVAAALRPARERRSVRLCS